VEEAAAAEEAAVEALDESDAGEGELPEDEYSATADDDGGAAVDGDGEADEGEADEENEAYAAVLPEPEHWSTFGA
jgi:hypothetical protein